MPLNPPPTVDIGLGLITQPLIRSDMSRAADVTFSVFAGTSVSAAIAQDTIDDFQVAFNALMSSALDSEVTVLPPSIRLGDGGNTPFEATAAGAPFTTTNVGTFMPPNVALLVKKVTGFTGKKNRGRTYYPFLLPNSVVSENGTITTSDVAAYQGLFNTFLAQLVTDSIPMTVSNKHFVVPALPAKPYVDAIHVGLGVTALIVENKIATQRRRLDR